MQNFNEFDHRLLRISTVTINIDKQRMNKCSGFKIFRVACLLRSTIWFQSTHRIFIVKPPLEHRHHQFHPIYIYHLHFFSHWFLYVVILSHIQLTAQLFKTTCHCDIQLSKTSSMLSYWDDRCFPSLFDCRKLLHELSRATHINFSISFNRISIQFILLYKSISENYD